MTASEGVNHRIAEALEKIVADNERGPDYGWTHPDEATHDLRRRIRLFAADLRAEGDQ